jgi:hypothetical protein
LAESLDVVEGFEDSPESLDVVEGFEDCPEAVDADDEDDVSAVVPDLTSEPVEGLSLDSLLTAF